MFGVHEGRDVLVSTATEVYTGETATMDVRARTPQPDPNPRQACTDAYY